MEEQARTPEEVRSAALARVAETLRDAWADFDSPILKGLNGDTDPDILAEMERITSGMQAESDAAPTASMVWEVVVGDVPNYSWWVWAEYVKGSYEVPGIFRLTGENPMGGKDITKDLTALDLLHAYQAMLQKTHCGGCDLIGNPDACSSDLILQQAMYGEIVYG
jgi:hypothetical protein